MIPIVRDTPNAFAMEGIKQAITVSDQLSPRSGAPGDVGKIWPRPKDSSGPCHYMQEMIQHLLDREQVYGPMDRLYLSRGANTTITDTPIGKRLKTTVHGPSESSRSAVVEYLVQEMCRLDSLVDEDNHFPRRAIHLTMHMFDRYVTRTDSPVDTTTIMQGSLDACIFLACKYEWRCFPSIFELGCVQRGFGVDNVRRLERQVLDTLNYDICVALSCDFLGPFASLLQLDPTRTMVAHMLCEISEYRYDCISAFRPSTIALACVLLVTAEPGLLDAERFVDFASTFAGYNPSECTHRTELRNCAVNILRAYRTVLTSNKRPTTDAYLENHLNLGDIARVLWYTNAPHLTECRQMRDEALNDRCPGDPSSYASP